MKVLNIFHKIIRAVLIIIPIFILGWLTVKELAPSGKVETVYDMRRETPFISKLYPKNRVSEAVRGMNDDYYRILQDEPVYFDLKPNDKFEKVIVTVKYKNPSQTLLKMGGLVNKKDWLFDWREMWGGADGWQTQTEVFEFKNLTPEGQKFRFGFSVPGLIPGQVEISEIKAVFERQPLTAKEAVNKILNAIVWRLNNLFGW